MTAPPSWPSEADLVSAAGVVCELSTAVHGVPDVAFSSSELSHYAVVMADRAVDRATAVAVAERAGARRGDAEVTIAGLLSCGYSVVTPAGDEL